MKATGRRFLALAMMTVVVTATGYAGEAPGSAEGERLGSLVKAADGFDLWYEVMGEGPAIIFVCRTTDEHRIYAEAMAGSYRVVLYEPRTMAVGAKAAAEEAQSSEDPATTTLPAHLAGRNLDWDPTTLTEYPIDLGVADLHTVADAAGVDEFVLAGYSGTAAYAAFLAPYSDRAVGLIAGGFSILGPQDYWVGVLEGGRMSAMAEGKTASAAGAFLAAAFYRDLGGRDQDAAFAKLSGPKIVWFGSKDTAPSDPLSQMLSLSLIAQRTRQYRADYERLGFQFIELEGYHHLEGYMAVDVAAPRLVEALQAAGWK